MTAEERREKLRIDMMAQITTAYDDERLSRETVYAIYEGCASVAEKYALQVAEQAVGEHKKAWAEIPRGYQEAQFHSDNVLSRIKTLTEQDG